MVWTGTANFQVITDRRVRVTGLSLAAGANGSISLNGGGGDEELPTQFIPEIYSVAPGAPTVQASLVDLNESLDVNIHKTATSAAPLDLIVTKNPAGLITFQNDDGVNATPNLEIYVHFKGG